MITDLDENCFRYAHTREEIGAMKRYIQWLKEIDLSRRDELENRTKELKDKKEEVEELKEKLKEMKNSLEKEKLENTDLHKEIIFTGETLKKISESHSK